MAQIKKDPYPDHVYENPFLKSLENFDDEAITKMENIEIANLSMMAWVTLKVVSGLLAIVWELRATRAATEDEAQHLAAMILAERQETDGEVEIKKSE